MSKVEQLKELAEGGNLDAQLKLWKMYENGDMVSKDAVEAHKWVLMASEQGDALSQLLSGMNYAEGVGVTKNLEKAFFWYSKSAKLGIAEAQLNLGNCYFYGHGIPQDYKEAFKWWLKSAEQGNSSANANLDKYKGSLESFFEPKENNISLINCEACDNEVSELAKTCPKCGHPLDKRNITEKAFDFASKVPQKVVEREGFDPNVKRGGKSKMFFFIWVPFAVFAMIAIPDPITITITIAFSFWLWWAIGKNVKPY